MKRKFRLASAASVGMLYVLGLGGCINDLLFRIAPLIT